MTGGFSHLQEVMCWRTISMYLPLTAPCLCCYMLPFSSCGEQGLHFIALHRLLTAGGFSCCGPWAPYMRASVVEALRLQSPGSLVGVHGLNCPSAHGNFRDDTHIPCTGRRILTHYATREIHKPFL